MGYTPPQLQVRRISGGDACYGNGVTTDDLEIHANVLDTNPFIKLNGNGDTYISLPTSKAVRIYDATAGQTLIVDYTNATNLARIETVPANCDLYLSLSAGGYLRFGTHTGTGDSACNGFITIKDSGGTTRKLMTTA